MNIRGTLGRGRTVWMLIAVLGLTVVAGTTSHAQITINAAPRFEASGSYSFVHAYGDNNKGNFNLSGGSASLAYRVRDYFTVVGDVGAYRFGPLPFGITSTMYTYLFGPRFTLRKYRRLMPFGQILLGGGRLNASSNGIQAGENGFALTIGGGLDVPFHRHFAIRIVQAEYLLTRFRGETSPTQSNARITAGFVVRFGGE
jgi:hypothetical protein